MTVLSQRVLNRTLLARQHLARRATIPPLAAIEHLVAVQAQEPNSPYIGLWTRLADFHRDALTDLLYARQVVRSSVLRGTQHMATGTDFRWLRPLVQPTLERARQAAWGRETAGVDLAELTAAARELLAGATLTRPQLGRLLADRWPGVDPTVLAWSVQTLVPVVHPPPNGTWNTGGATPFVLAEEWLGAPLDPRPDPGRLIRRYLAAFGPATVRDIQVWCGLTRLREVVEGAGLREYRDGGGAVLYDVPDGELAADGPAPVRFLPDFDNVLVGHADRTRLMTDEHRKRIITGSQVRPTLLVDGVAAGLWGLRRTDDTVVLRVEAFGTLSAAQASAVAAEGALLLGFAAPDHAHDVRFEPVGALPALRFA